MVLALSRIGNLDSRSREFQEHQRYSQPLEMQTIQSLARKDAREHRP